MNRTIARAGVLAASLLMALPMTALADTVIITNTVAVNTNVTKAAGTTGTGYVRVDVTNNTPATDTNGCNVTGSDPLTVNLSSSNTKVTVDSSVVVGGCGIDVPFQYSIASDASGSAIVSITSVTGGKDPAPGENRLYATGDTLTITITAVVPANTAPSVPGAPTLDGTSATPNQGGFGLTWTSSTDDGNPSGSAITYTLQGKDANDASYATIASGLTTNAYSFGGGQPAEGTWTYKVIATDGTLSSAASAASSAIVVDLTAPSAPTASFSKTVYYLNWFKDGVTVSYGGSTDPALLDGSAGSSGITYSADDVFASSGAAQAFSGTATDAAGNTSSAATGAVDVDATAPDFTCDPAPTTWSATNISVDCSGSDAHSGVKSPVGTFSLTTSVAAGSETSNASTGTATVLDNVDHSTSVPAITGLKVDRKGPVVTLTCPTGPVELDSSASASWTASDGGSGVANGFGSGSVTLDTSDIGSQTASVAAGASKDEVGNTSAEATCTYSVIYHWTGFYQPVDNDHLNTVKAGSAVPVKFSLSGNQGLSIFYANFPKSSQVACDASLGEDAIESTVTAGGSSLSYDSAADQYVYVWKTDKAWAGTCRALQVKLADGTSHWATFKLTK